MTVRNALIALCVLALPRCADIEPGPPPVDLDELAPVVAHMQMADGLANQVPILVRDSIRELYLRRTLRDFAMDSLTYDSLLWEVRREPEWIDSLFSRTTRYLEDWQRRTDDI